MEYRSNSCRRDLAHRVARQSDCDCAKLMGNRLCIRGAGCRNRAALCRLADGIFRGNSAGAGHVMDSKGRAGVRNVEGAPRQDRGASRRRSDSRPANTSCRTGFHPHLPASIRKTHFCSSIHEFLWHVRLVGPVHLDATISVAPSSTRRSWLRRHGNHHPLDRAELVRDVSWLCQLRLDGGSSWTKKVFHSVYVPGCSSSSTLCARQSALGIARGGNGGGILWHRLFFWVRDYRRRKFFPPPARPRPPA